jgi:hypothetical protein
MVDTLRLRHSSIMSSDVGSARYPAVERDARRVVVDLLLVSRVRPVAAPYEAFGRRRRNQRCGEARAERGRNADGDALPRFELSAIWPARARPTLPDRFAELIRPYEPE